MPIKIISSSASTSGLLPKGPVSAPLSDPACQVSSLDVAFDESCACTTGLWECSPGSFRRAVAGGEVMHILTGKGSFQPDEGPMIRFQAGDTLFFPPKPMGSGVSKTPFARSTWLCRRLR